MVDMKLYILDCGALHADKLIVSASFAALATRHEPNRPATWHRASCHSVLIEHPGGRMVWDTGAPRDWEERWAPAGLNDLLPYDDVSEEQYFDSRLMQLGFEPDDIDTVVLSHLHLDHSANAKLFEGTGARFVTHEKEVAVAESMEEPFLGGYCKADFEGLDLEGISGDVELYPGISVIEAPGHSPGVMALRVDLPDSGTMIFTSDACDSRENWGPPPLGNIVNWCNATYMESVEKLRAIAEETDATVVFSHDYEQLHSLKLSPDGFYT